MWYWMVMSCFALWVLNDGYKRKTAAILWAISTFALGPIVLPAYLAVRPLNAGETREGGRAWNILKNFALCWTVIMVMATVSYLMSVSESASSLRTDAQAAGFAIGWILGMGFLGSLWFFPMIGAIVLGAFLKKSSAIEHGPTEWLATGSPAEPTVHPSPSQSPRSARPVPASRAVAASPAAESAGELFVSHELKRQQGEQGATRLSARQPATLSLAERDERMIWERSCPNCQEPLQPSARFCSACGWSLSRPVAQTAGP